MFKLTFRERVMRDYEWPDKEWPEEPDGEWPIN